MLKKTLSQKQEIIALVLKNKLDRKEACNVLTCTDRTLRSYIEKALRDGLSALEDKRGGNNRKLTFKQENDLIEIKEKGRWRSARKALELTGINGISGRRVQQIWVKHNLHRENIERLKPIIRFVAPYPNDLWQSDIQGKLYFPFLGNAYLIATIDDHSRFILGAKWFSQQTQMNVFRVWYHCLFQWGLPKKMLQDKGSQYKANARYTQTGEYAQSTFQFYAKALGIDLILLIERRLKARLRNSGDLFSRILQEKI